MSRMNYVAKSCNGGVIVDYCVLIWVVCKGAVDLFRGATCDNIFVWIALLDL